MTKGEWLGIGVGAFLAWLLIKDKRFTVGIDEGSGTRVNPDGGADAYTPGSAGDAARAAYEASKTMDCPDGAGGFYRCTEAEFYEVGSLGAIGAAAAADVTGSDPG